VKERESWASSFRSGVFLTESQKLVPKTGVGFETPAMITTDGDEEKFRVKRDLLTCQVLKGNVFRA